MGLVHKSLSGFLLTATVVLVASCGEHGPDPLIRLDDSDQTSRLDGRVFQIRPPGSSGVATLPVVIGSSEEYRELISVLEAQCDAEIGMSGRLGTGYDPMSAPAPPRGATCGIAAARISQRMLCLSYELMTIAEAQAPVDLLRSTETEPARLRLRRLTEEIPITIDDTVFTIPTQDAEGRASLALLAVTAAQHAALAAAEALDPFVCPDGTLYGTVPNAVDPRDPAWSERVPLAYVLTSGAVEAQQLMLEGTEMTVRNMGADAVARSGTMPEARDAARQWSVARTGSLLEAVAVLGHVPERHFDLSRTSIAGVLSDAQVSDLTVCDEGSLHSLGLRRALELMRASHIDPRPYLSETPSSIASLARASLVDLQPEIYASRDLADLGDAEFYAHFDTSVANAVSALRWLDDEQQALGRPRASMPSGPVARVHGTDAPSRPVQPAFLQARLLDAVVDHPLGDRGQPAVDYGHRDLLAAPTGYGTGPVFETVDVLATSLANAMARTDVSTTTSGGTVYDDTRRTMAHGRLWARGVVPQRIRTCVGHDSGSGGAERARLEIFGLEHNEASQYEIWIGEEGLACALDGTVAGQPCNAREHRLDPSLVGTATGLVGSGLGETAVQVSFSARDLPTSSSGVIPASTRVYVIERTGTGGRRAVGGVSLAPGAESGDWSRCTLSPAGPALLGALAGIHGPSPSSCNEPANICAQTFRIPLENELTRVHGLEGGDPYEGSWSYWVDIARRDAADADALGEQLIANGLEMDLRVEQAAAELEELCGGVVNVDYFDFEGSSCDSDSECEDDWDCLAGRCQPESFADLATEVAAQNEGADAEALAACLGLAGSRRHVTLGSRAVCVWVNQDDVTCGDDVMLDDVPCPFRNETQTPCDEMTEVRGHPIAAGTLVTAQPLAIVDAEFTSQSASECEALSRAVETLGLRAGGVAAEADAAVYDALEASEFLEHATILEIASQMSFEAGPFAFSTLSLNQSPWLRWGSLQSGASPSFPCAPADFDIVAEVCDPSGDTAANRSLLCGRACSSFDERYAASRGYRAAMRRLQVLAGIMPITPEPRTVVQDWTHAILASVRANSYTAYPELGLRSMMHVDSIEGDTTICDALGLEAPCFDPMVHQFVQIPSNYGTYYGMHPTLEPPTGGSIPDELVFTVQPARQSEAGVSVRQFLDPDRTASLWASGGLVRWMVLNSYLGIPGDEDPTERFLDYVDERTDMFVPSGPEEICEDRNWTILEAATFFFTGERPDLCEINPEHHIPRTFRHYIGDAEVLSVVQSLELACWSRVATGGYAGCSADLSDIPEPQSPRDLTALEQRLECAAERLDSVVANVVLPSFPSGAADEIWSQSISGATHLTGMHLQTVSEIRAEMENLDSAVRHGSRAVRDFSSALAVVRGQLEVLDLQNEIVALQSAKNIAQQVTDCGTAIATAASMDPAEASGEAAGAAMTCMNSGVQSALTVEIMALSGQITDLQQQQVLIEAGLQFGASMDALSDAEGAVKQSVARLNALLAQLDAQTEAGERALGRILFLDEVDGREMHVNTVMRRRYNTTRIRYERALDRAIRSAYVARRAIEQRFAVDLTELESPLVTGGEAPAAWADLICSLQGIDYSRIRTAQEGADYEWSNEYVGDYVRRLESFVEDYQRWQPFQDGTDVAVVSLRDDLLRVHEPCEVQSPNLLLMSSDLTSTPWTPSFVEGERAIWVSGVTDGATPFAPRPQPDGTTIVHASSPVAAFDITSTCDIETGCVEGASSLVQAVDLAPGDYVLSWYEQVYAGAIPDPGPGCVATCATACADPSAPACAWCTSACRRSACDAVSGVPPQSAALVDGALAAPPTFLDPAGDPWIDSCAWRRAVVPVTITTSGAHVFGIRPIASGSTPVVLRISAPQLEADDDDQARAYVHTDSDRLVTVSMCEDVDGSRFRAAPYWSYGCEHVCPAGDGACEADPIARGQRRCYWQTEFSITQSEIDRGTLFGASGFALGSYNYRLDRVALNLVGSAVRDCEGSSHPSACWASANVQYSLHHDGPFHVRAFDGEDRLVDVFDGRIESARALAAERYLTNPLASGDRALIADYYRAELVGRPLAGHYALRVWDTEELNWSAIEDVQILLEYRYWTRLRD